MFRREGCAKGRGRERQVLLNGRIERGERSVGAVGSRRKGVLQGERIGERGRTGHASACDGGILVPDDPEEW